VPSAVALGKGDQYALDNASGGIVRQSDAQPTGTGVIKSFVRVQGSAKGGGSEQGYNTTARPLQFDENKSPQFTRALTVGEVPVVTVDGVNYREFLLDVNQKASSSKISVDEVRVFLGDRPDLTGYDPAAQTLAGKSAVFDMDAGGDRSVVVDARFNSGSGSGDMTLLVPDSAFAGSAVGTYVYVYSKMGATAGADANGGFEEWAVRTGNPPVAPPSGTGSLSGFVYADANANGVRDAGEAGIRDVAIKLEGTDANGNTVVLTTTTASDGGYAFADLAPGTYTITEEFTPFGYADGEESLGTLGGDIGQDQFLFITLAAGQDGMNYNFGEVEEFG
jgi:hypothetical protein